MAKKIIVKKVGGQLKEYRAGKIVGSRINLGPAARSMREGQLAEVLVEALPASFVGKASKPAVQRGRLVKKL